MFVRPISTAPAALSRATMGASRSAGGASSRARERPSARDVEQVLDRDWNARKRRDGIACGAELVLRLGRHTGTLLIDLDEGAFPLARGIGDAVERRLYQRSARGAASREIGRKFGERGSQRGGGHEHAS